MRQTISYRRYSKLGDDEKARLAKTAGISALVVIALLPILVATSPPSRLVFFGQCLLLVPLVSAMPWEPSNTGEWTFSLLGVGYLASVAAFAFAIDRLGFDLFTKEGDSVSDPPLGPLSLIGFVAGVLCAVMAASYVLDIVWPVLSWLNQP